MLNIQIRDAEINEIPIVYQIMRAAFEEYRYKLFPPSGALREKVKDIIKKISNHGGAILVFADHSPVGSAQYYFQEDYMYIGRVSVIKDARGMGLGKQIMKFLEEKAIENSFSKTRIEVRASIPQNIEFYSKLNYIIIEEKKYPLGIDRWYVMNKNL